MTQNVKSVIIGAIASVLAVGVFAIPDTASIVSAQMDGPEAGGGTAGGNMTGGNMTGGNMTGGGGTGGETGGTGGFGFK